MRSWCEVRRRRGYGIILLCLLLCGMITTTVRAEDSRRVVRIGCFGTEVFLGTKEDEQYHGFLKEYMDKICEYTGWDYELVHGTQAEIEHLLETREVDFICSYYDENQVTNRIYTSSPVVTITAHLYVEKENDSFFYEDYEQFDGIRIGVWRESSGSELLDRYAEQKGFSYEKVSYETSDELLAAMDGGEVEAILLSDMKKSAEYKDVAQVGLIHIYGITWKENSISMDEWDLAASRLQVDVPDYLADLYETYYQTDEVVMPSFTRAEMEYIRDSAPIPVALMTNQEGLSFYDGNGFVGIVADVMRLIEERSGLTFTYVELEKGVRAVDVIEGYDNRAIVPLMLSGVVQTSERLEAIHTNLESAMIPVGRRNSVLDPEKEIRIVLPKSFFGLESYLTETFPMAHITYLEDTRTCLERIQKGEADLTFGDLITLKSMLTDPHLETLVSLSAYSYPEHMYLMVGQEADPVLISILKKTADVIGREELSQLLLRNVLSAHYQMDGMDFLYKYRVTFIAIGLVIFALLTIFVVLGEYRRRNEIFLQKRNEQLRDAMEQVENANMAKTTFLARVSHEIRTPMNAIVGIATLAENHLWDQGLLREDLAKIRRATGMLLELVNDILDMSAIEKDSMRIGSEPFCLKDVMDSVQSLYEPLCEQKNIRFRVERAGEMESLIYGDALRLNQVLNNLLNNAWKFTERSGNILVTVQTHRVSDKQIYVDFAVADDGCGIGEEMLSRLFKPFQQENPTVAKQHGGSGLGLSICKNLVELMHGSIQVESTKGKGTTFRFSLPFACQPGVSIADIAAEIEQEEEKLQEKDGYDFGGRRVLLAEDNEINMEIAAEFLQMAHLEVEMAEDGVRALQMYQDSAPGYYDLILTDIQMPNMGGHELARQIRALPREDAAQIPMLAMTANAFQEDIALSRAAGMDGHVAKPIDPTVLYEEIKRVLKDA